MNTFTFFRANLLSGLKPATHFAALLIAVFLLAACGGGGGGSSSGGGAPPTIQVTNLNAIPGSSSLTLTWENPNANIGSFDIDVYNLATNGTTERVVAASQDNITMFTSPAVDTTDRFATARYTISSGLMDGSHYSVAVTVNLQGAEAGRATSARGLSGRRYLPANGVRIGTNTDADQYADVEDNCPAIKNDDQANTYGGADNIGDVCGDFDVDGMVDAMDVDADGDGLIEISTAAQLNMMRNNLAGTGLDADNSDRDNTIGGNSMGCASVCNGYEQMADIDLNDLGRDASGSNWEPLGTYDGLCSSQCFSGIFNGNDYTISNLNINRPSRDGVGFFGAVSYQAKLLNIKISGVKISGGSRVGGLVGYGERATITSAVANVREISGAGNNVGGLVGWSWYFTIDSAEANVDVIRGGNDVGGLVGRLVGGLTTANATTITSAVANAREISGAGNNVGGLVGIGLSATITSAVANVREISGTGDNVGGLVGDGFGDDDLRNALSLKLGGLTITSAVANVSAISGDRYVGGLVGNGQDATIISAVANVSAVASVGAINIGRSYVGGLVGNGQDATITSAVANVDVISGAVAHVSGVARYVGGLVGDGQDATITSSVANVGEISGNREVGGLVGDGQDATITSSVANVGEISGNREVGGLVGDGQDATITAAYYDGKVIITDSSGGSRTSNRYGQGYSTTTLQSQTAFLNSIYSTWASHYCNPNTGEYSATLETGYTPLWNLGTATQYPALNCLFQFSLAEQRAAADRIAAGQSPLPN